MGVGNWLGPTWKGPLSPSTAPEPWPGWPRSWLCLQHLWDELPAASVGLQGLWEPLAVMCDHCHGLGHAIPQGRWKIHSLAAASQPERCGILRAQPSYLLWDTRQLLRGHLGLHSFPSSMDKGSLLPQTGASMFPALCLKQYFPLASSWQWAVCYTEKWLPGVRSCLGAESPFPWHPVVTPDTPQSPGRCQCPAQVPSHPVHSQGSPAQPSQGLRSWAVLLPGGVMKTHNGVSFCWTPSAFSILHIIQEILVYTLEELL